MVHGSLAALAVVARRAEGAPRPRKAALELTDAAVERVKMLLDKRNKVRSGRAHRWDFPTLNCTWLHSAHRCPPASLPAPGDVLYHGSALQEYLRLGVKTRGCNGMAYTLNYADSKVR